MVKHDYSICVHVKLSGFKPQSFHCVVCLGNTHVHVHVLNSDIVSLSRNIHGIKVFPQALS